MTGEDCIHHWVLESPHGPAEVSGRCKKCGTTRNYTVAFDDTILSNHHRWKGGRKGSGSWGTQPISPRVSHTRVSR